MRTINQDTTFANGAIVCTKEGHVALKDTVIKRENRKYYPELGITIVALSDPAFPKVYHEGKRVSKAALRRAGCKFFMISHTRREMYLLEYLNEYAPADLRYKDFVLVYDKATLWSKWITAHVPLPAPVTRAWGKLHRKCKMWAAIEHPTAKPANRTGPASSRHRYSELKFEEIGTPTRLAIACDELPGEHRELYTRSLDLDP